MLSRLRHALGRRHAFHHSIQPFSSSALLCKRVTHGTAEQLLDPVRKKAPPVGTALFNNDPVALEFKQKTSGSIVLDTVREYTKQHPQCVLLVQVGDFYEVSRY
jgi:DNA mismatch repair protein MutS